MGIWIAKTVLQPIKRYIATTGMIPQYTNRRGTHGNNRKPTQETQDARKWFEAYVKEHSFAAPGGLSVISSSSESQMVAEGADEAKTNRRVLRYLADVGARIQVYKDYVQSCEGPTVSARSFFRIWDRDFYCTMSACRPRQVISVQFALRLFVRRSSTHPSTVLYREHIAKVIHERVRRRRELIQEARDSDGTGLHCTFDFAEPVDLPYCLLATTLTYFSHTLSCVIQYAAGLL